MKDEKFIFVSYVVALYIIAFLPISKVLRTALMFVVCSVFLLLGVKGKM